MNQIRNIALAFIATLMPLLSGCQSDSQQDMPAASPDTELTISGLSDDKWTYISLRDNIVVGHSDKDDEEADSKWASRSDWDIAICGDMIRTNGGTSGKGYGGLRRVDDKSYGELTIEDGDIIDQDSPNTASSERK